MKLYKLKHLPTGLYFTPSKGSGNLSVKGKVYVNIVPRLEWCENVRIKFYTDIISKKNQLLVEHFKLDTSRYIVNTCLKTLPSDWEIIEIQ
jgi:hypothetical protein